MSRYFFIAFLLVVFAGCTNETETPSAPEYNTELLQRIRAAASIIPGPFPTGIGYLKFSESIRKWSEVIEGGSEDPCKMARTAFQIHYPDGWVMVDAGMDRQVHKFFEKEKPQPFDDAKADRVRQAVEGARLVLITHEHGDHVAGVIRTANTGGVPHKTLLTREQADALMTRPQMPEIKLGVPESRQYLIASFESLLPVAPGLVLIKAPGHTPGELMIYARLQNGKEYLFTGDVSWSYQGIAEKKGKPENDQKRIGENASLVNSQLAWLNQLLTKEKVTLLVSHDDIMLPQYAAQGLIADTISVGR
ncbi:MBL fold metallo-hydrolase [Paraflavisolibacter sp. H34]|uniref:MBL fold metallo-hydrolase n=1 Tax=Huijunlia imazamoxiresistens TaxID=3127457 RepID=UPI003016EFE8